VGGGVGLGGCCFGGVGVSWVGGGGGCCGGGGVFGGGGVVDGGDVSCQNSRE